MNDYVLPYPSKPSFHTSSRPQKTTNTITSPFALKISFEEPHGRIGKVRRKGQDIVGSTRLCDGLGVVHMVVSNTNAW